MTKRLFFLIAVAATSACGGATTPLSRPAPTEEALSPPAPTADLDELVMARVAVRLGCNEKLEGFFCQAVLAFASGAPPRGRSTAIAMAGASAVVPGPRSPEAGKPPRFEASYLVLADDGARFGTILPTNDAEKASAKALLLAVVKGEAIPPDSTAGTFGRSRTGTKPARVTGSSLSWSNTTRGFARETKMGIVVVEFAEELIIVGVFPSPARPS